LDKINAEPKFGIYFNVYNSISGFILKNFLKCGLLYDKVDIQ